MTMARSNVIYAACATYVIAMAALFYLFLWPQVTTIQATELHHVAAPEPAERTCKIVQQSAEQCNTPFCLTVQCEAPEPRACGLACDKVKAASFSSLVALTLAFVGFMAAAVPHFIIYKQNENRWGMAGLAAVIVAGATLVDPIRHVVTVNFSFLSDGLIAPDDWVVLARLGVTAKRMVTLLVLTTAVVGGAVAGIVLSRFLGLAEGDGVVPQRPQQGAPAQNAEDGVEKQPADFDERLKNLEKRVDALKPDQKVPDDRQDIFDRKAAARAADLRGRKSALFFTLLLATIALSFGVGVIHAYYGWGAAFLTDESRELQQQVASSGTLFWGSFFASVTVIAAGMTAYYIHQDVSERESSIAAEAKAKNLKFNGVAWRKDNDLAFDPVRAVITTVLAAGPLLTSPVLSALSGVAGS